MTPHPKIRIPRPRSRAAILSAQIWAVLGLALARAADPCAVPMLVEFQTVSTNRIKTGHAGFYSRNNQPPTALPKFYLTNTIHEFESIQVTWAQQSYASTLTTTQQVFYPLRHYTLTGEDEYGCPLVKPISARSGSMQHEGSYISGCHPCEASLVDDEWIPDDSCPACHEMFVADMSRNWQFTVTGLTNETQLSEEHTYHDAGGSGFSSYRYDYTRRISQTLSGEYATEMLLAYLQEDLLSLPWPTHWSAHGQAGLSLSSWEKCAEATRLRYRIRFIGTKGETGNLEWVERFVPVGGGEVRDNERFLQVTFTGAEQSFEGVIEPPPTPGTIELVTPLWKTCSDCELGQVDAELEDGPSLVFGLGQHGPGQPVGFLYIRADRPGADLATPRALKAFISLETADVVTNVSGIRQVKTGQALVDIREGGPQEFAIEFYLAAGPKDVLSGLYSPLGQPFSRWTLARVNELPYTLRISQFGHAYSDFVHTEGAWTLQREDESVLETSLSWQNNSGQILTNIHYYHTAEIGPLYQETAIYTILSNRPSPVISKQIIGADTAALTNLWFYYDDLPTDHVNYGKSRMVLHADGTWERYEYDPEHGRLTKIITGFLDSPPDAPETECRVLTYDYTPLHPEEDRRRNADTPRTVVEQLRGVEVSRRYLILAGGERREIQCQTPGAAWDALDNLISVTKIITRTNGWEERLLNADGTLTLTRWETNSQTGEFSRITERGQPAGDLDHPTLLCGTREEIVHDSNGLATAMTRTDITSQIVLASRRMQYDPFHRLVRAENLLDGTVSENHYDCCSLAWTCDANGAVTIYTYDAWRRPRTYSQYGITISNVYHPQGQIMAQWRIGTDGSAVRLRANQYDLAGRLTAQTNALNQVTLFIYGTDKSGRTYVKTVHPDGAWEIQSYYRDNSVAELTGNAVFPVSYAYGIEQDEGAPRFYEREIRIQDGHTNEWIKTLTDMLGRPYKTVFASAPGRPVPVHESSYDRQGRLWRETDPDGVTRLFFYDGVGRLTLTGIDRDGDGRLAGDGSDRQEQTQTRFAEKHGCLVEETLTWFWPSNGVDTIALHSGVDRSVDGLRTWFTQNNKTNSVEIHHESPATHSVSMTSWDGTRLVHIYQTGRLAAVHRLAADHRLLAATNYTYDTHGRRASITDLLGGNVTRLYYNLADLVVSNILSTADLPGELTVFHYDGRGRLERVQWPDGTFTTNQYHPNGLLKSTGGTRTSPAEYTYDRQGRLATMRTWRSPTDPSSAAITTWHYDPYRGFLTYKQYPDGNGPRFNYSLAGRLVARLAPRKILTSYHYNRAGELMAKQYSDTTPDLAFDYDRAGQLETIVQGTNTTELAYDQAGQVQEERYRSGVLRGLTVTQACDPWQRPTSVALDSHPPTAISYAYDAASRLAQVTSGPLAIMYQYGLSQFPATNLVFHQEDHHTLSLTRLRDSLGRVREISLFPERGDPIRFAYRYNLAGERTWAGLSQGIYWTYSYDPLGQVVAAHKFWSDHTPVAGQHFQYYYDLLGNRISAGQGGNPWGRGLHFDHYTVNSLNQYETRFVAGVVDVSGTAHPNATVSVNGSPTRRKEDYYWAEIPVENGAGAVYLAISNLAVLPREPVDSNRIITGHRFLPRRLESFVYDADGNLVQDGRWSYTWNAENQLTSVESLAEAPPGSRRRLTFAYDWQGRRIQKAVDVWKDGVWVQIDEREFVYSGWQLLAELSGERSLRRAYVWGIDRSGTLGGAAGVGGLLAMLYADPAGAEPEAFFCACDANDNVVALIRAEDGSLAAEYEYGPFGELLRINGPRAWENPFQFSTRYQDRETGLTYFGHRYYNPSTGRWLIRDPAEEQGGPNLYGFAGNDPLQAVDPFGLETLSSITVKRKQVLWLALLKSSLGKKPAPDDPYGHWWIELDGESYGWWPEEGVTLIQTLAGVPGKLNGTATMHAQGLASPTRDGHHGDTAELEFQPSRRTGIFGRRKIEYGQAEGKSCKCADEAEIKDCLKAFARQYSGNWSYPWGQNCHSFQRSALCSCCLKK
jgi:RHS repeat-associated protein